MVCRLTQSDADSFPVVVPVQDPNVRGLCRRPYAGHPKGCPNWNKRSVCPPESSQLKDLLNSEKPVYCIYNKFDLAEHIARMRKKHPDWSERQLHCCLYWQGTARKQLREKVKAFLVRHPGQLVLPVPEACSVDVTATMATIGITLEWPPKQFAYQVALAGTPLSKE